MASVALPPLEPGLARAGGLSAHKFSTSMVGVMDEDELELLAARHGRESAWWTAGMWPSRPSMPASAFHEDEGGKGPAPHRMRALLQPIEVETLTHGLPQERDWEELTHGEQEQTAQELQLDDQQEGDDEEHRQDHHERRHARRHRHRGTSQEPVLIIPLGENRDDFEGAKQRLGRDTAAWEQLAMEYFVVLGGDVKGTVNVRAVARAIADVHFQLGLATPSDQDMLSHMMPHVTSGSFGMAQDEFVEYLCEVFRSCADGVGLGSEEDDDLEDAAEQSTERREPASGSDTGSTGLEPSGRITVTIQKMSGVSVEVQVDGSACLEALEAEAEKQLGYPVCQLKLVFGVELLQRKKPLYKQGLVDGSIIMAVCSRPQATLLRIRRARLGDTSIPTEEEKARVRAAAAAAKPKKKQAHLEDKSLTIRTE